MQSHDLPADRKRPFVRFLIWVYMCTDGDRNNEGAILIYKE